MKVLNCLRNNAITSHTRLAQYIQRIQQLGEGRVLTIQNSVYEDTIELLPDITVFF